MAIRKTDDYVGGPRYARGSMSTSTDYDNCDEYIYSKGDQPPCAEPLDYEISTTSLPRTKSNFFSPKTVNTMRFEAKRFAVFSAVTSTLAVSFFLGRVIFPNGSPVSIESTAIAAAIAISVAIPFFIISAGIDLCFPDTEKHMVLEPNSRNNKQLALCAIAFMCSEFAFIFALRLLFSVDINDAVKNELIIQVFVGLAVIAAGLITALILANVCSKAAPVVQKKCSGMLSGLLGSEVKSDDDYEYLSPESGI